MNPLAELVRELVHAPASADMREERLKSDVYRLRCTFDGATRSFVGKRLEPDIARRNELVARRWLPAAGLGDSGPPLLATVAERDGSSVWHLYEDLGDCGLDVGGADFGLVSLAVATIARIHTRFAQHPLVPEFRVWGGDLGIYFYGASVADAITSLEAVLSQEQHLDPERMSLCNRLLARLSGLLDQREARAETLALHGGPETLLHGDLWPMNVMIHAAPESTQVRLIDWDHAAVGPVSYDLSTFLHRFPIRDRMQVLHLYETEVADAGWRLPPVTDLNLMFETAELARIANRVIWPALAASENGADWAYAELQEVERWFEQLEPILPLGDACAQL